jgi:hypothetical protein
MECDSKIGDEPPELLVTGLEASDEKIGDISDPSELRTSAILKVVMTNRNNGQESKYKCRHRQYDSYGVVVLIDVHCFRQHMASTSSPECTSGTGAGNMSQTVESVLTSGGWRI